MPETHDTVLIGRNPVFPNSPNGGPVRVSRLRGEVSTIRKSLILLLATLLSFSTTYASDNKWEIEIALDKQEYVLYEPVWLDVTLTNIALDTIRTYGVSAPNHRQFHILLTDSDGKQMKHTGLKFSFAGGPGDLLLDAGESDYDSFNLLELFRSMELNTGYVVLPNRFPFIPEGTYSVVIEFESELSNVLTFSIVAPHGQEEEVLRKIEQASRGWSKNDTDRSSQIFGQIESEYPNSPFTEKCYYLSRVYSKSVWEGMRGGSHDIRVLNREMLSKFPNSGYVKSRLWSVTREMTEDEEIELYTRLIAEHPDTRCSKIAGLLKKRLLAKRED
ncbi:MAG: hypothetical protein AB1483_11620 [Candidatus Zixiibacteriota bacterium]